MKLTNNLGMIFLSIYLLLVAFTALIPGVAIPSIVFGIVALVAALLILINR